MTLKSRLSGQLRRLGLWKSTGHVDRFDAVRIVGWTVNPKNPDEPVWLTLYVDGKPDLAFVADTARRDVETSGLGPLHCGFDIAVPRHLRGQPHRLEIRVGATGKLLRGGVLDLAGPDGTPPPDAAALSESAAQPEGVAFFDADNGAIAGWAFGTDHVVVQLDRDPATEVVLDRGVAGFGQSIKAGFAFPVPERYLDGRPHQVRVRFGQKRNELDGSPFSFTASPVPAGVDLVDFSADGTAQFAIHGAPAGAGEPPLAVRVDGQLIPARLTESGMTVQIAPDAVNVVVETALGQPVAHFVKLGGMLVDRMQPATPIARLASPDTLALANRAFDAFCARPDSRFDPLWYRLADPEAQGLDDPDQLIALYRASGARRGIAPNGLFDEQGLRRSEPELAALVETGQLPCLFALQLALGERHLPGISHLPPHLRRALAARDPDLETDAARLNRLTAPRRRSPAPAQDLSGRDSIYSAWLSRLIADDAQLAEIAADDRAVSAELSGSALLAEPLVSIIMPSWNRAFTIGEAVQSVIEQSYPNWELIICDDASEDRTPEVVRRIEDPRIRYNRFLKSNGAGARNKGLRLARGRFIAYLDSDNIWHPNFLDLMVRRLLANPGVQMAYCGLLDTEIDGAAVRLETIARASFRPIPLSSKNFIDLNCIMHDRQVYDLLGGFDPDLPRLQDWDLVLRYTSVFRPLFVDRIGVFYRRNIAWGQVTQLFKSSNAQAVVADKTRRRLAGDHVRLDLPQRGNARLTVMPSAGDGGDFRPQDLILAVHLARAAARQGEVDLLLPADCALTPEPAPGLRLHHLPAETLRNGAALGELVSDRPVLLTGTGAPAGDGFFPQLQFAVGAGVEGGQLRNLAEPRVTFPLGPVPLTLPTVPQGGPQGAPRLLVLAGDATADEVMQGLADRGMPLLIAPAGTRGWLTGTGDGQLPPAAVDGQGLALDLAEIAAVVALDIPEALPPLARALLAACQAQGLPVVLPDDRATRPDGFAAQWIDAKAASVVGNPTPARLVANVAGILRDKAALARRGERSRTCYAIADHPALFDERLAFFAQSAATESLLVQVDSDAAQS